MDLAVIALTFAAIFVVELPDKTFIATLVLATKYPHALVWLGVGLAFAVQTGIAVALGQVATLLPTTLVEAGAAALFLVGGVILLREAIAHHVAEEGAFARGNDDVHGLKVALTSFLVLFAAEWGDLSQLLTLSLVAKYGEPLSVFTGAWGALLAVSGLAVLAGRVLLRFVPVHALHYLGAAVCFVLGGLTLLDLAA